MKNPVAIDRDVGLAAASELGITSAEMYVRLARKRGVDKRVIVRSRGGGLRIVQPGETLRLTADEFIANLHPRVAREATREIDRIAVSGRKVTARDLSD